MSNNKQSSIEWLYNKMYEHRGNITIEEFEQAKAMYKKDTMELSKNSYIAGYLDNGYYEGAEEDSAKLWDETYAFKYNETFNNHEKQ